MENRTGLLGLLNYIGGGIIYVLIGEDAWDDSDNLNRTRPFIGGFIIGIPVGLVLSAVLGWAMMIVSPLVVAAAGVGLEEFRRLMED